MTGLRCTSKPTLCFLINRVTDHNEQRGPMVGLDPSMAHSCPMGRARPEELNFKKQPQPRPTYISALLTAIEEAEYATLLKEFEDVFSWTYKEILGLDPKVAVHQLLLRESIKSVKQAQRRFRQELVPSIEAEVRKKKGQIRVCLDFRDLNHACPKDDFPLPIPGLMIDATTGHKALTFD
ncbi:hypothetical protein LIER_23099 [Lithospermum erythrorhizon]|uniref:Uncharacterized protein n=1 Tax=Lithospermum erythrorhizon TaxID=34254 RepID=A0AAV3QW66_LITER